MQFGFKALSGADKRAQANIAGRSQKQARTIAADHLIGPFNQTKDTINEIIEMTGAIPLFDKIDSVQVGVIAAHMQVKHLDENQRLFAEGEASDYICFVVSGTLEVFKQSQTGKKVSVSTLSRGRCIGEMALLDSYARSATVIARTPCTLLKLSRESFDHILDERPRAGISLLKTLSKSISLHLRKTSGQFADAHDATTADAAVPVLNEKTTKQPKLIDHIINRKESKLPPLIRQFI
ncbi:cyclic nucleotide-binding domain-containing protein [Mariprofundus sp. NF]|uniref:cyclic nucleotide-binding domain-containing protein n=1 Tax=Mariprofundus sp. NF TaxID=2608716 RepID=UPI0015A42CDD|nr:cyclic nucleotide-binding domain-containing protein [Mariprofundus sp. NF]NWF39098.1 cyclic nucleotide-binding domain-containing protein [Mariprofundus sp. NF]